jgi:hypothetical protein
MHDTFSQGRDIRLIQKMTVYYNVTLLFCTAHPSFCSFSLISLYAREPFRVYMAWAIIIAPLHPCNHLCTNAQHPVKQL